MAVRIIKNSWWTDFRVNHTRYRKRSPENSKAGAQAYEATLRSKLARGESIGREEKEEQREPTFGEFAPRWFHEYVVPNGKPSTQDSRKRILFPSLVPFFGKVRISEITANDIERYKAHLLKEGLARRTVNERLVVLNSCIAIAYKWLELKGTPPEITWLKCPPPTTDYLSFSESELLLSNAEGVVRELVLTALKTGMRLGELIGLQWGDIDWENRLISVRHSWCNCAQALGSPKNNNIRYINMTTDLHEVLRKRRQATGFVFTDANGNFNHSQLNRKLKRVCEKAGLRPIGWHTLRHTFASHLVIRGAPLPVVQKLLGHSSIEMTMRYTHLAPSTLQTAIDLLDPAAALLTGFGQQVGNRWREAHTEEVVQESERNEKALSS